MQVTSSIRTQEGPGWGLQDRLEGMRRRELEAFCYGHQLMEAVREITPEVSKAHPPAVLMRKIIRDAGMTGLEPIPEVRHAGTPVHIKTDYSKWRWQDIRNECTARGIKWKMQHKREDLVALLEAHDGNQDGS